jgi:transcriptional regulator with XRE-family HTH domain
MGGEELRRLRHRARLTQAQLAERVGVTPNSVARWERNEVPIRAPMARLIRFIAKAARKVDREGGE